MGIFLIIFGTRGITYSSGQGNFYCPSCGTQPYRQKRVRRFFTLYFIPVIPLDLLGEYVECCQCQGTYRVEVLDLDPGIDKEQVEAEFQLAIKRTMVLMCLADGVVDDSEVAAIRKVYGQIADRELTERDIRDEISTAQRDGRRVAEYLGSLVGVLNDNGKEMIVKAAFLVAAADGEFQDEEKELLAEIGQALQMSSAHVSGVIAAMLDDSE